MQCNGCRDNIKIEILSLNYTQCKQTFRNCIYSGLEVNECGFKEVNVMDVLRTINVSKDNILCPKESINLHDGSYNMRAAIKNDLNYIKVTSN